MISQHYASLFLFNITTGCVFFSFSLSVFCPLLLYNLASSSFSIISYVYMYYLFLPHYSYQSYSYRIEYTIPRT